MRKGRVITTLLVVVTAAPVAAIALWSLSRVVTDLTDPCASWGQPSQQGQLAARLGPDDPCKVRSFHGSKTREVMVAALVPGGVLAAGMLAVAGAALSRRRILMAAGIGMLAETLVVFTIAPLTLIAGVTFLLTARRLPRSP